MILPFVLLLCAMTLASGQTAAESDSVSLSLSRALLRAFQPGFDELSAYRQRKLLLDFNSELRALAHGFLFIGMGLSAFLAMGVRYPADPLRRMLAGYLLAMLAAVLDETHQLFIDGRDFQLLDLFVDWGGAGLGSMAALAAHHLVCKRKRPVSG